MENFVKDTNRLHRCVIIGWLVCGDYGMAL